MFWRRRGSQRTESEPASQAAPGAEAEERVEERPEAPAGERPEEAGEAEGASTEPGPIELDRDAPRPVAIQHVAEELSRRGDRVAELFKEVSSPHGRASLAIYALRGSGPEEQGIFVEVATGPWDDEAIRNAARTAAILRGSDHADAPLEVVSAYPVPDEVRFFAGRLTAALLQLDLVECDDLRDPEACAESFRGSANRHWGLSLGYETEELPLIEELLTTALDEATGDMKPPVLDPLVYGLGCYVGETLRRHSSVTGSWERAGEWGERVIMQFPDFSVDPVGQARAFLENGPDDSTAFFVEYVLRELGGTER